MLMLSCKINFPNHEKAKRLKKKKCCQIMNVIMLTIFICFYLVQVGKFSNKLKTKANQQLVKLSHVTTICAHPLSVTSFEAI